MYQSKDPRFKKATESGICRTVHTACKMFAYGGDAKISCHGRFVLATDDLLKANNFRSLPLTLYRGNHFNILSHNTCTIYWEHQYMINFFEKDGSFQWVLHDLKIPFVIAGCKALRLVCNLITILLWNLIENHTINIIDKNAHYLQLVTFLRGMSDGSDNL